MKGRSYFLHFLGRSSFCLGGVLLNSIIVHPDYAKDPEAVRDVARALLRASRWLIQNPPEAAVASMKPVLGV